MTRDEIELVVAQANPDKAPGPDGFSADFFHKCWDMVKDDVMEAVQHFFKSGKFLREVNHTFITLVPQSDNADSLVKYRPISLFHLSNHCVSVGPKTAGGDPGTD